VARIFEEEKRRREEEKKRRRDYNATVMGFIF